MSDTPRTDEHMLGGSYSFDGEFARQLERELNAALAKNTAMREAIREAHDALANVSTTFGRTPAQDVALAKLQPFITP
jgi:hypothetical protein